MKGLLAGVRSESTPRAASTRTSHGLGVLLHEGGKRLCSLLCPHLWRRPRRCSYCARTADAGDTDDTDDTDGTAVRVERGARDGDARDARAMVDIADESAMVERVERDEDVERVEMVDRCGVHHRLWRRVRAAALSLMWSGPVSL